MLCSKAACEDKRKYRVYYWPNRRLQSTRTEFRIPHAFSRQDSK